MRWACALAALAAWTAVVAAGCSLLTGNVAADAMLILGMLLASHHIARAGVAGWLNHAEEGDS